LSLGGATDSAIVDATSTVLLSIEGRDRVSVAAFVKGYTEAVSGAKQVENMISSLSRALSTDVILPRKQLPVMPKLRGGNDAKGAKAQLRAWKRWADKILPAKIGDSDSDMTRSESAAVARAEVEDRVKESEKETAEALLELREEGPKDDKAALPTISEDAAADVEAMEVAPATRQKKRHKPSDASESAGKRGRGSARRKASDDSDCSAEGTTPRRSRRRAGSDASETSTESARLRRSTRRR
ncbi:hypothetical protein THAOC_36319, partial [Thalassiosira oceanica]